MFFIISSYLFFSKHGTKISTVITRMPSNPDYEPLGSQSSYRTVTKISTFSVGWFAQGCRRDDIDGLVNQLENRLRFRFKKLPHMNFWIDASCMYQPPPWSGHIGSHEAEISNFVGHRRFKPWLTEVRDFLDNKEAELAETVGAYQDSLNIVVICRAGRNRSVSGKMVLDFIFSSLGYTTKPDGYLSKAGWHSCNHDICSTCPSCIDMTPLKKTSLIEAFRIWSGLK